MRSILFLACLFLFLSCEDKKTKKKDNSTTEIVIPENKEANTADTITGTLKVPKRKFPKLDSKSAMEFFLEYDKHHIENKVRISTDFGDIDIILYKETKFHRSNFIWLTKQGYFNGTQFYRVIDDFMIQGGNGDDVKTSRKRSHIGKYLLPPDTKRGFKHDRGVIAMPSSEIENPYKLASPFEFFIVSRKGGAHYLNGDYTIFGHVIKGMNVVDKIAAVKTDDGDWPVKNIYINKVKILD